MLLWLKGELGTLNHFFLFDFFLVVYIIICREWGKLHFNKIEQRSNDLSSTAPAARSTSPFNYNIHQWRRVVKLNK